MTINSKETLIVFAAVFLALFVFTPAMAGAVQNPSYPAPGQCGGADWNIGLPDGVTCSSSVYTGGAYGALENNPKATMIFGQSSRLKPDLASLNQFCKQYTNDNSSYATYGRMHNYCNGCDQNISWYTGSSWVTQQACAGTLNVQEVRCGTSCSGQQQIACGCDADCGANGFVDSTFCKDGQVYKNYKSYTCSNPGTSQSHCANSTRPVLWYYCAEGQTCSGGYCHQTECLYNISQTCAYSQYYH